MKRIACLLSACFIIGALVASFRGPQTPRIVIVGDSHAYYLPTENVPGAVNLAVGGMHASDVADSIPAEVRGSLRVIVVSAGMMDDKAGEDAIGHFRQMLDDLPRQARVIVLLPVPVNDALVHNPRCWGAIDYGNHEIRLLRYRIEHLCQERHITTIAPPVEWMLQDGQMNPTYTRDGLHLSEAAYAPWIKAIKEATR